MNKSVCSRFASVAVLLGAVVCACGQGTTFLNLDFESVSISPPDRVGEFPFATVFPQWNGYVGTNQASEAAYNLVSAGGPGISLISPHAPIFNNNVIGVFYTAALAAGTTGNGIPFSVGIEQSSLVPLTAQSLRFSASGAVVGHLKVTLNGQNLPYILLGGGPNFQTYGAEISEFAGSTASLRFTEAQAGSSAFALAYLDDVFFSNEAIPEPSGFNLLVFGALFAVCRFLTNRKARRNHFPLMS
jgi:hypothetical protein